jgi:hypothetical protein
VDVVVFIRNGGQLTPALLDELRRYGASPWLSLWRRFTHSALLPTLWMWRKDVPGARYDLPVPRRLYVFRELAQRNAAAGYFALVAGDAADAERRARENIAGSRQLMRGSTEFEDYVGQAIVQLGRTQLDVIGRRTQNVRLIAEAERIKAALSRWRNERLPGNAWAAMLADPANTVVLDHLARDPYPKAAADLVQVASVAYCRNPREMLFGIDPRRRALLHQLTATTGARRFEELARMGENWLDDTEHGIVGRQPPFRPFAPLGWFGFARLRDRMSTCVWTAAGL